MRRQHDFLQQHFKIYRYISALLFVNIRIKRDIRCSQMKPFLRSRERWPWQDCTHLAFSTELHTLMEQRRETEPWSFLPAVVNILDSPEFNRHFGNREN